MALLGRLWIACLLDLDLFTFPLFLFLFLPFIHCICHVISNFSILEANLIYLFSTHAIFPLSFFIFFFLFSFSVLIYDPLFLLSGAQ